MRGHNRQSVVGRYDNVVDDLESLLGLRRAKLEGMQEEEGELNEEEALMSSSGDIAMGGTFQMHQASEGTPQFGKPQMMKYETGSEFSEDDENNFNYDLTDENEVEFGKSTMSGSSSVKKQATQQPGSGGQPRPKQFQLPSLHELPQLKASKHDLSDSGQHVIKQLLTDQQSGTHHQKPGTPQKSSQQLHHQSKHPSEEGGNSRKSMSKQSKQQRPSEEAVNSRKSMSKQSKQQHQPEEAVNSRKSMSKQSKQQHQPEEAVNSRKSMSKQSKQHLEDYEQHQHVQQNPNRRQSKQKNVNTQNKNFKHEQQQPRQPQQPRTQVAHPVGSDSNQDGENSSWSYAYFIHTKRQWENEYQRNLESFQKRYPRLTNVFYDANEFVARIGEETPLGFPRKRWLEFGICFSLLTLCFMTVAALGLSPRSIADTKSLCWVYNTNFDGGVWMMPSGYVTFTVPLNEQNSHQDDNDDDDDDRNNKHQKSKKRQRKRRKQRNHGQGFMRKLTIHHRRKQDDDGYRDDEYVDDDDKYGDDRYGDDTYGDDKYGDDTYGDDGYHNDDSEEKHMVGGGFVGAGGSAGFGSLSLDLVRVEFPTCARAVSEDSLGAYMYSSGFIGDSAQSLSSAWPGICNHCRLDSISAIIFAMIAYLSFFPEIFCFWKRRQNNEFHPEYKFLGIVCSLIGSISIFFMMIIPTKGCLSLINHSDIGSGSYIGPGVIFGWLSFIFRFLFSFITHLLLIEEYEQSSSLSRIRINFDLYHYLFGNYLNRNNYDNDDDDNEREDLFYNDDDEEEEEERYIPRTRRMSQPSSFTSLNNTKKLQSGKNVAKKLWGDSNDLELGVGPKEEEFEEREEWVEETIIVVPPEEEEEENRNIVYDSNGVAYEEYSEEEIYQSFDEVEEDREEMRYDEGKEFTLSEFIEFYGENDGRAEWNDSEVVPKLMTKVAIDKTRSVKKRRPITLPKKKEAITKTHLVKRVTKVPISSSSSSKKLNHKIKNKTYSPNKHFSDNDNDDDDTHSQSSSTSSSSSKLQKWIGKRNFNHSKEHHHQQHHHYHSDKGDDDDDAFDRKKYVELMKTPRGELQTRRVKTEKGFWRTEARDPDSGYWVLDDRDFRIRLAKRQDKSSIDLLDNSSSFAKKKISFNQNDNDESMNMIDESNFKTKSPGLHRKYNEYDHTIKHDIKQEKEFIGNYDDEQYIYDAYSKTRREGRDNDKDVKKRIQSNDDNMIQKNDNWLGSDHTAQHLHQERTAEDARRSKSADNSTWLSPGKAGREEDNKLYRAVMGKSPGTDRHVSTSTAREHSLSQITGLPATEELIKAKEIHKSPAPHGAQSISRDLSADDQLSEMCFGLSEAKAADLKSAWMKILNFLQQDQDTPLRLVKMFKEAEAEEAIENIEKNENYLHSNTTGAGVSITRLLKAMETMGVGLTVSEALIWLERQDMDGDGVITINELSTAIAVAANIRSAQASQKYKLLLQERKLAEQERLAADYERNRIILEYLPSSLASSPRTSPRSSPRSSPRPSPEKQFQKDNHRGAY